MVSLPSKVGTEVLRKDSLIFTGSGRLEIGSLSRMSRWQISGNRDRKAGVLEYAIQYV